LGRDKLIKDKNRKWLIFYLLGHVVLFALLAAILSPTLTDVNDFLSKLKSPSGFFPILSFPLAIVLEGLIHSDHKAVIVFWRTENPDPGSRAFSHIAPKDPRINMDRLHKLFPGGFPQDPDEQNSTWYRLYRKYSESPIVYDAHRFFLLTRDLAALTVVLIPFCIIAHLFWHSSVEVIVSHVLVLAGLAFITLLSAKNYGKRFVANVLVEATLKTEERIQNRE
jgi:hypothetical protein